jgi:hypothetical protein
VIWKGGTGSRNWGRGSSHLSARVLLRSRGVFSCTAAVSLVTVPVEVTARVDGDGTGLRSSSLAQNRIRGQVIARTEYSPVSGRASVRGCTPQIWNGPDHDGIVDGPLRAAWWGQADRRWRKGRRRRERSVTWFLYRNTQQNGKWKRAAGEGDTESMTVTCCRTASTNLAGLQRAIVDRVAE